MRCGPAEGSFRCFAEFAAAVRRLNPEVRAVARIIASPARRGGAKVVPLAGEPVLDDWLGGSAFRIPAASFFQVNTPGAEGLVAAVAERAGPLGGQEALDLYSGLGAFALALGRRGASVTAVEADAAAVAAGREAASRLGPGRVRFVHAGVAPFLRSAARRGLRPHVIVAHPPRAGLGAAARIIPSLGTERIVLVSCDPVTLACDVRQLASSGYAPSNA